MSGHYGTNFLSVPNCLTVISDWCRTVWRQKATVSLKHDGTDDKANKGNICFPSILPGENLYAVTVRSVTVTKYVNIYYEKLINTIILLLHSFQDRGISALVPKCPDSSAPVQIWCRIVSTYFGTILSWCRTVLVPKCPVNLLTSLRNHCSVGIIAPSDVKLPAAQQCTSQFRSSHFTHASH